MPIYSYPRKNGQYYMVQICRNKVRHTKRGFEEYEDAIHYESDYLRALKALKDLKVKVYTGFVGTVQQAMDIYTDGRLKDSGAITGIVAEDSASEHEGGGGPPSSKDRDKRKEKDEAEPEVF